MSSVVPKELVKELLHQKVFFYHTQRGWELGSIQNVSTQETRAGTTQLVLTIRCQEDEQLTDVVYKPSLIKKCTAGLETMSPDNLLTLPELHHAILVHALHLRHKKDIMYTSLGELVVAINPFKYSIPWYQDSVMQKYLQYSHQANLPPEILPHTWSVAHRAYVSMNNLAVNQSIIISGESGSGKTESCKTMLKYLCQLSEQCAAQGTKNALHAAAAAHTINDRIQQSNIILEAFGNAKTLRNDNSSRFGKLTEVQFNKRGVLVGMRTTPFLLERSRIVHCALDERVFHCFYQLAAGATKEMQKSLRVKSARDFQLLSQGKCTSLKASGVDDAADFQRVRAAMTSLRFGEKDQETVWKVVAAVAHLQNVQFVDHQSAFGKKASENAELDASSVETVTFVAKELLDIADAKLLLDALVTSTSVVKGEVLIRQLSTQKAMDQRDSICKLLYTKLFLWIVDMINTSTAYGSGETDGLVEEEVAYEEDHHQKGSEGTSGASSPRPQLVDDSPASWIALLDIFGFEDFPINRFEQLCINLANEALQRHYTRHHFIKDKEEMNNEGITTQQVTFFDNMPCVELLQGAKNSIIAVLDDCSTLDLERAQVSPNVTFLDRLTQIHRPEYQSSAASKAGKSVLDRQGPLIADAVPLEKPSDFFFRGRLDDDSFTIRHFAGDVKYKIEGFVEKNVDHVRESSVATLRATNNDVLLRILDMDENIGLLADLGAVGAASPGVPRDRGAPGSPTSSPRGSSSGGAAKRTVASQFRASLKLLMDTLDQSNPHWVRCIRPHARKSPDLFDGRLVLEQLMATGVLATIEQRQRNFPFRIPHLDFIQRFGSVGGATLRRLGPRTHTSEKCAVIIGALRQRLTAASANTSVTFGTEEAQVGRGKVFLSTLVCQLLERERVAILDQHVQCTQLFALCYRARKVTCLLIWTRHAIQCQRMARRTLRIRRGVKSYYAELRQRIIDRHLQEQRDLLHTESKLRPRTAMEEQQAFVELTKMFRTQLLPMIAGVLKNIRVVEGAKREDIQDELQKAHWALEVAFAEGVATAHERRKRRVAEEHRCKVESQKKFIASALDTKQSLCMQEVAERQKLQEEVLPKLKAIHARAAVVRERIIERDREIKRLQELRGAELQRLAVEEEQRVQREHALWRSVVGEDEYLRELARWRHAPSGSREAYMRQFCAARLPTRMLTTGGGVTSETAVRKALYREYQQGVSCREAIAAGGVRGECGDATFRKLVIGDQSDEWRSDLRSPQVGCVALPPPPRSSQGLETSAATITRLSPRRSRACDSSDEEGELLAQLSSYQPAVSQRPSGDQRRDTSSALDALASSSSDSEEDVTPSYLSAHYKRNRQQQLHQEYLAVPSSLSRVPVALEPSPTAFHQHAPASSPPKQSSSSAVVCGALNRRLFDQKTRR